MAERIFVIEDDENIREIINLALVSNGYEVVQFDNAIDALAEIDKNAPDLAIFDLMLPKMSGLDAIVKIRETNNELPILILSAKDREIDKVNGLDSGSDDYMTKPFKLAVFLSRINALLRRSENFNQEQAEPELQSNGIRVQLLKQEVTKNGVPIDLTASEYKLLRLFMENPNIILSPEQILSKLWDCDEKYIDNNTLTVYIRRLRTKVEDNPADPQKIVTVRRMGYKWSTAG